MNRILCFVATILIGTINCQFRPINMYDCNDGTIYSAIVDSMIDTPGCALPQCGGATAGKTFDLIVNYPAKFNAQNPLNYQLYITGVAISTSANDPFANVIRSPLSIPTPIIVTYNSDLCQSNPQLCPQYAGQNYTFSVSHTIPNEVTTSASLIAEFKAVITSGSDTLLCFRGYDRLMSPSIAELAKLLNLPPLSIVG